MKTDFWLLSFHSLVRPVNIARDGSQDLPKLRVIYWAGYKNLCGAGLEIDRMDVSDPQSSQRNFELNNRA